MEPLGARNVRGVVPGNWERLSRRRRQDKFDGPPMWLASLGFADALAEQKAVIETHLGLEIRLDVKTKSIQQLGTILKLVGLRLERIASSKRKGRKVYQYRLEPKSLAGMRAIVEARKAHGQRQSCGRLFGSAKADDSE
jgi:hypothetical protein